MNKVAFVIQIIQELIVNMVHYYSFFIINNTTDSNCRITRIKNGIQSTQCTTKKPQYQSTSKYVTFLFWYFDEL